MFWVVGTFFHDMVHNDGISVYLSDTSLFEVHMYIHAEVFSLQIYNRKQASQSVHVCVVVGALKALSIRLCMCALSYVL